VAEVPEAQAVNVRNRDYIVGLWLDIPGGDASGVLFAHGSHFGGHTLYVKDNRLHYVYNFVGMLEQEIVAGEDLPVAKNLIVSAEFVKDDTNGAGVCTGVLSLYQGEKKVAEDRIKTQPAPFGITGSGLTVGRSGHGITYDYPGERPWPFTGGTIHFAAVDVSGEPYVDVEREAAAMMARE
jgi:arylsulfatase